MKIRKKAFKEIDMSKFHAINLCNDVGCAKCPVRDLVGESDSCTEWMKENMNLALELLGWERENEKMEWIQNVKSGKQKQVSREGFIMSELCEEFRCNDCPIWKKVEEGDFEYATCKHWMMNHWDEGLKLLGWEKVESPELGGEEEMKQNNSQSESPDYFLMRHLGVGYRERFYVDGTEGVYYVGVAGRLFRVYDGEEARKREIEAGQVLYLLLEHPERVRKIGITEEHREYLEAVKRVFPEVGWVKREGGWLLFGDASVVLLSRECGDWDELREGEKVEVEKLLEK